MVEQGVNEVPKQGLFCFVFVFIYLILHFRWSDIG